MANEPQYNLCNPHTKTDTGFPLPEWVNPILTGQYQNAVQRTVADDPLPVERQQPPFGIKIESTQEIEWILNYDESGEPHLS